MTLTPEQRETLKFIGVATLGVVAVVGLIYLFPSKSVSLGEYVEKIAECSYNVAESRFFEACARSKYRAGYPFYRF
jgi:hypothetical protein